MIIIVKTCENDSGHRRTNASLFANATSFRRSISVTREFEVSESILIKKGEMYK